MSYKPKKKESKSEPANKTRIKLRLQKYQAYSPEKAMTLKELGLAEKRFKKHIETLIAENFIKKEGKSEHVRYWIRPDKIQSKKSSNTSSFLFLWISMVFVLLIIFILFT
ncbi:MAG: hypothetical protein ACXAC7_15735 [Candidatus Hodarchaeales archaeon]|jgi:hypothetical protein